MQIRRYQESDRERVWELHNVPLQAIGLNPGNGAWDDDLHRIPEIYTQAGGEFLVGSVADQVVAMGALLHESKEVGEIKRMRVWPDFQRRGYGRLILTALEERARELGYARLHLCTTSQQVAARHLYEAARYAEASRTEYAGFLVIEYRKELR